MRSRTLTTDDVIGRLTDQNVSWVQRGAAPTGDDRHVVEQIRRSLTCSLPLVRSALDRGNVDCLVVPGGVYGTSGLFLNEAKARGCRVATFDTDRRIAQICVDGVAAQNGDIPMAFHSLWNADRDVRQEAVKVAMAEFRDRSANRDQYGFQVLPARQSDRYADGCVLIPLNVEWDTAALGRHVHFESTADWLISTVSAVLDQDAGPVVVRQHPSERRPLQRSKLDVAALLRRRFGEDPRCQFVAADDPVSSYDLLRAARLVLPFVSTIGIEAAAMGKPVLIAGACYYTDLGFVWSAGSREEYFDLLHRGLRGDLTLRPDQAERAWLCYYLTAVRNRVLTDFTPHPDDFWTWCQRPFPSLLSDPAMVDILEAIDTGVPISLLRHARASSAYHCAPDGPTGPDPGSRGPRSPHLPRGGCPSLGETVEITISLWASCVARERSAIRRRVNGGILEAAGEGYGADRRSSSRPGRTLFCRCRNRNKPQRRSRYRAEADFGGRGRWCGRSEIPEAHCRCRVQPRGTGQTPRKPVWQDER